MVQRTRSRLSTSFEALRPFPSGQAGSGRTNGANFTLGPSLIKNSRQRKTGLWGARDARHTHKTRMDALPSFRSAGKLFLLSPGMTGNNGSSTSAGTSRRVASRRDALDTMKKTWSDA